LIFSKPVFATVVDCADTVTTGVPQTECEALVALYNSTTGTGWTTKTNWNTASAISTWSGVTVVSGHVKTINLSTNHLVGTLPTQIGDLPSLTSLNVFNNKPGLSGSIPTEIGNLTSLTVLNMASNSFSGSIPTTIGNLTSLTQLYLHGNTSLSGTLPSEIGNLTSLTILYIAGNFTDGPIPSSWSALTNLTTLALAGAHLNGSIPTWIGTLTHLTLIDFTTNSLSGSIPTEIGNCTSLATLKLQSNSLTGSIPASFSNLTALVTLRLDSNQLTGSIPFGFSNTLRTAYLNSNQLSGPVPADIASIPMTTLDIKNNFFVFSDFEAEYSTYDGFSTFNYDPQGIVDTVRTTAFNENDTIIITPSVAANANDSYQWYKDTVLIPGATSRLFTKSNASGADAGVYSYVITNSIIPTLTLSSNNITLNITPQPPTSDSIYYIYSGISIWARGKISDTKDIAQQYILESTNNQEIDFGNTYITTGNTNNNITSYQTGTLVVGATDDTTPVSTNNIGYLTEGHGLVVPVVTSIGHDKTGSDIGSIWTDGTYQYVLAEISGNDLTFYSESYGSPWRMRTSVSGVSLTHVSGATHTTAITVTSQATAQKYPIVKNLVRHVKNGLIELIDGNSGYADSIDLSEEFDLVDPSTIVTSNNPFVWNDSTNVWIHIKNEYHVTAGTTIIHSTYDIENNIDVGYFGFIQAATLSIGSYDKNYYYIPKTKNISGYDFKAIQDLTTPPVSSVSFTDPYMDDINSPPDREIILLKRDLESNYDIGFALGYSPFSDSSRSCNAYSRGCWWIYTTKKTYPIYIAETGEINGTSYDVYSYRQWLDPKAHGDNKLAYWNNQNGHDLVYVDYHKSVTNDATVLPTGFTYKAFNVVESENVTASQSFVPADGIKLSTTGANTYGYIILELYDDVTAPTGGSITYTGGYNNSGLVDLTVADGTDSESNVDTASRIIQRKSATLTNGICGGYNAFATIIPTGSYPNFVDNTVSSGNCYQYQYLVSDNSTNQVTYTSTVEIKVSTVTYILIYTAGAGGSITGTSPQTVNYGSDGTSVTAVPNHKYHFVNWSDGVLIATRNDINILNDINITANFEYDHISTGSYKPGYGPNKNIQIIPLTTSSSYTFTKTLKYKMIDNEVKELQKYLNTHNYLVATTGYGSLNNETTYFGKKTKAAVIKFQLANGLVGDGVVGPKTKAELK